MNIKKLLGSTLTIGVVAIVAVAATSSYFSDTETSENNSFIAGEIDLQIDALLINGDNPNLEGEGNVVIEQGDLNGETIFTYTDLKPGDMGTGNYSIHATSNDYWACIQSTDHEYLENGINDPEDEAGDVTDPEGELQNYMTFAFWNDVNGNGTYEDGTDTNLVGPWLEGTQPWIPEGLYTLEGMEDLWFPLADVTPAGFFSEDPLSPDNTYYLGFKYCFGELDEDLNCDGSGEQNDAQTDSTSGTLNFYAVQSRNNDEFECSSLNPQLVLMEDLSGDNLAYNQENKDNGHPYIEWEIDGNTITIDFVNPTSIGSPFPFDYRLDNSAATYTGVTGVARPAGAARYPGVLWGDFYTFVNVAANSTETRVLTVDDEIRVRLFIGPERDYDFDWIIFQTQ